MALTPKLELRQSQSLVMTPQLQQAIKLLQLSNLELSSFVEEQVEKNPLLEIEEREGGERDAANGPSIASSDGRSEEAGNNAAQAETDMTAADKAMSDDTPATETQDSLDTDYDNLYSEDSKADLENAFSNDQTAPTVDWSNAKGGSTRFDSADYNLEATLASDATLRDHLTGQLQVAIGDPARRVIGIHLIDTIDEAGYLTEDLAAIAERLGAPIADVLETLSVLQKFDPPGIFCRDLAECLAIQLREKDRFDPAMERLIQNLDLLGKHDHRALMDRCEVDAEDLDDMIKEIRQLDPKPGLVFGGEVAQPVIPDVYVRQTPDGGWRIELNTETLPRVLINQQYAADINKSNQSKEAKAYLSDCFNTANWLVKSLDQRAKTILKVATEVVKQQDAFLVHGVQHLRPLNLRTVAEAISMHESTVSRVTANKYMATHRGVFELKYFFTSAIASSVGGEAHSAEAVRHRIRILIENEAPNEILSDDRIVDILLGSGIDIARRTVAKYREALHIPSSVQRRRLKRRTA